MHLYFTKLICKVLVDRIFLLLPKEFTVESANAYDEQTTK